MLLPPGEWGVLPGSLTAFLPTRRRSKPAAREAFATSLRSPAKAAEPGRMPTETGSDAVAAVGVRTPIP